MIDGLLGDIRYGVRALAQRPGFTAVALLALALGIGANSAIFSVVNAVLLRPLPYKDPDRIVMLWQRFGAASAERSHVSPPEFVDYQSQSESFEQMAAYMNADVNLTGGGEPERMSALVVSPGLHPLLGAQPIQGRAFLPEEAQPGRNLVVLVSHGLWQRRFGGAPNLVGETITINGRNRTVVGIMAPDFRFPNECDLWLPLAFTPEQLSPAGRGSHFLSVIGRLKSDVKIQQAQEEVKAISSRFPGGWITGSLVTLRDQVVGDLRPALLVLWGAVGFVLLICCANVANLLLARAAARQKEIAIRSALGAPRLRIVRQLLTESLLLSVLGGGLGVLVAMWGIPLLVAVSPDSLARTGRIELDGRAIVFTLAVSILTGLIFGLAPALQASKPDLNDMLKEGKGSAGDVNRHRIRNLLAISEIALALLLSVGAGLTIKSFVELMKVEMGFNPDHVLAIDISLPGSRYSTPAQQVAFYKELVERVETLPDSRHVGLISDLPMSGANADRSFVYEGMPPEGSGIPTPGADYRHASPGYFQTMSIPLLTGRFFTAQDAQDAPRVAIVNDTLARHIWPNEDPVGKKIRFFNPRGGMEDWLSVVGLVGDVKHHGLELETKNEIYVPHFQTPVGTMTLVVRSASEPSGLVPGVRSAVQATDPDQPIFNIRTMDQLFSESVAVRRLNMLLLGVFAAVALILATVGIYGVMSYAVAQRTQEIGLRMALGAQSNDVVKLVVNEGMKLALIGVAIGVAASLALTRLMQNLLFGVKPTDPLTLGLVTALLTLVALAACWIPARRASKVDPMVALRCE